MGYHVVDPDGLDPTPDYPCDRRSIADAAGLSVLAAATYDLAPGEELARHYHSHDQREELLYVLAGDLHVETPGGEHVVHAGRAFVAEADSPHRPFAPDDADQSVRVLGVGAPRYDPAREYDPDEGSTGSTKE